MSRRRTLQVVMGTAIVAAAVLLLVLACPCTEVSIHRLNTWVPIGPEVIVESIYAGPNSGRGTVLAVNPFNVDDVWMGTATGGVWHSSNISEVDYLWESMTHLASSMSIGAILLEDCTAERCNTVWIGTGENNIRRDTYYGMGLMKLVWDSDSNCYSLIAVGDTESQFEGGSIIDIARLSDALYIAVSKGKSSSSSTTIVTAPEPEAGYGIHRSTDEGLTWEKVGVNPMNALASDMELHNGTVLVGFYGVGIFRLSSEDEWCPLGPYPVIPISCDDPQPGLPDPQDTIFNHVELAVSPVKADVIYAALGVCESETFVCEDDHTPLFYTSLDGGLTWDYQTQTESISNYPRYTHVLMASPGREQSVYYGGLRLWGSAVYGTNFGEVSGADYIHYDMQDLAFPLEGSGYLMYIACDGGFYIRDARTDPLYPTVTPRNYGLETVQFYSICTSSWDRPNPLVLGGTQDNGTLLFNGSPSWEFILDGDGGDCIIASDNLNYASKHNIAPYRAATSLDPGYGDFIDFDDGISMTDPHLVFPPFLMHPKTEELYYGTNRLYRRTHSDPAWQPASPYFDHSSVVLEETERRNAISAVALSYSNPDVIYVALHNGDIWTSFQQERCVSQGNPPEDCWAIHWSCVYDRLGEQCWIRVGGEGVDNDLPDTTPTSLDVDPNDPSTVYVAYSDFTENPKVWRSTNGGVSWQEFSTGLPNGVPVNVIRVKPDQPEVLFLGTDIGVFRRDLNGMIEVFCLRFGSDWVFYGPDLGMPIVPVYDFGFDTARDVIYAATHGRGVYMLCAEPVVTSYIRTTQGVVDNIYLSGHAFTEAVDEECKIDLLDQNGRQVATIARDVRGGPIKPDPSGRLASWNPKTFGTTRFIHICEGGFCHDDLGEGKTPISSIAELRVTCGEIAGTANLGEHPTYSRDPPSTILRIHKLSDSASGKITLEAIAMTTADEQVSRADVTASVEISPEDSEEEIIIRLASTFNEVSEKRRAGYQAIARSADLTGEIEHEMAPSLILENTQLEVNQILTGIRLDPGEIEDLSIEIESIGLFAAGEFTPVQIMFSTLDEGAKGGELTLTFRSPSGVCTYIHETKPGDTAQSIAEATYLGLENMSYPGTSDCESRQNTYDLRLIDNSLITSSTMGLYVQIDDSGVGVVVSAFGVNKPYSAN